MRKHGALLNDFIQMYMKFQGVLQLISGLENLSVVVFPTCSQNANGQIVYFQSKNMHQHNPF